MTVPTDDISKQITDFKVNIASLILLIKRKNNYEAAFLHLSP
jgi:hypothetical protein